MTIEEIKNLILRRAYTGAFEDDIYKPISLSELAQAHGIEGEEISRASLELGDSGLIQILSGWSILSTSSGLLYAEEHKIADEALIKKRDNIQGKLLVTLADLQDRPQYNGKIPWEVWIREAGVSQKDFANNDGLLKYQGFIDDLSPRGSKLTSAGMKKALDYRKRIKRQEDFERLEKLEGVTKPQRGHKLEDLLADTAEWEGWEAEPRVIARGEENDIIMRLGPRYFLSSCKWVDKPLQSKEVMNLESRVRGRAATAGGILFSMSGLTDNCIAKIRELIPSVLIIPFGPEDIRRIMQSEATLTTLLDNKIDQIIKRQLILVDGESK